MTISLPLAATINISAAGAITGQITEPAPPPPPTPTPPTVGLTAAATSATAPGAVTLTAVPAATTSGATIKSVDFYEGTTKLGTATAAPWTWQVSLLAAGTYSFTAIATDSNGLTATSSPPQSVTIAAATTPPTPTPGAPVDVLAFASSCGRAYCIFGPPANNASNPAVGYIATAMPSGITAKAGPMTVPNGGPTILGCRVDFDSLPAGVPQTITVQAVNAAGDIGPASLPSSSITPTAAADYYMACGGGIVGLNPDMNDAYHFNANPYRYVQPGTPTNSPNAIPTTAPANPVTPADGVIEVVPLAGVSACELQLFFHEENPKSSSNGVFNASPFAAVEFDVWPLTAGQKLSFPAWETTFNMDSVVTAGANSTTELVDAAQNWPANQWLEGGAKGNTGVFNRTQNLQSNYVGNTADTIQMSGMPKPPNAGDHYYVQSGDQSIGQTLLDLSKYLTSGTLAAGQWSHIKIPMTEFNLPTKMLYKFHVGIECGGPNTTYFANSKFSR